MKTLSSFLCALLLLSCGKAPTSSPPAPESTAASAPAHESREPASPASESSQPAPGESGTVFGPGLSASTNVLISTLLADSDSFVGKRVRVEGVVTDVCPKRGCWMELAGDRQAQSLRFKVEDGVISFPLDIKGKYAVAEGIVRKIPLSVEQATAMREHEASEYGRPVDKTAPLPEFLIQLEGIGAVVRDRK